MPLSLSINFTLIKSLSERLPLDKVQRLPILQLLDRREVQITLRFEVGQDVGNQLGAHLVQVVEEIRLWGFLHGGFD
jgi:hypothetical protein